MSEEKKDNTQYDFLPVDSIVYVPYARKEEDDETYATGVKSSKIIGHVYEDNKEGTYHAYRLDNEMYAPLVNQVYPTMEEAKAALPEVLKEKQEHDRKKEEEALKRGEGKTVQDLKRITGIKYKKGKGNK